MKWLPLDGTDGVEVNCNRFKMLLLLLFLLLLLLMDGGGWRGHWGQSVTVAVTGDVVMDKWTSSRSADNRSADRCFAPSEAKES